MASFRKPGGALSRLSTAVSPAGGGGGGGTVQAIGYLPSSFNQPLVITGHQAGDLIVLHTLRVNSTPVGIPSGWTDIIGSQNRFSGRLMYRIADNDASITVSGISSHGHEAVIFRNAAGIGVSAVHLDTNGTTASLIPGLDDLSPRSTVLLATPDTRLPQIVPLRYCAVTDDPNGRIWLSYGSGASSDDIPVTVAYITPADVLAVEILAK